MATLAHLTKHPRVPPTSTPLAYQVSTHQKSDPDAERVHHLHQFCLCADVDPNSRVTIILQPHVDQYLLSNTPHTLQQVGNIPPHHSPRREILLQMVILGAARWRGSTRC